MSDRSFSTLKQRALTLSKKFPNKWDAKTHFVDLVEEVGELGNAVLVDSGDKSEKRRRADLKDSFADVLFELILMADECNVDLEKELSEMLDGLEKRLNNEEYKNI